MKITINDTDFGLLKRNLTSASECLKGITPISHAERIIFNRLRNHLQTAGAILGRQVMPELTGE